MDAVNKIDQASIKGKIIPDFSPGDTVEVYTKIKEGDKIRTQRFQGIVINRRGEGIRATFTLRRVLQGIGVERIFPLYSPTIQKLQVVKKSKSRRAKLFYLRTKK